jgi:hypothetical protein
MIVDHTSLEGSSFVDVNLHNSNFNDVSLRNATFENVGFTNTTFNNVCFGDVRIVDVNLEGATINGILITDLLRDSAALGAMTAPQELQAWFKEKANELRWGSVRSSRRVSHEWSRYFSGRKISAALTVSIAPAADFSLRYVGGTSAEYVAAINNALFSVLLSQGCQPVLRCALAVESIAVSPMEAEYPALYEAAKEATERLLGVAMGEEHNILW